MPDSSGSTWWGRASALALGDFKRDVFVRDTLARSVSRLVTLFCVLAVVIILAISCLLQEPAIKNRTHTYRVTNVKKLPSGKHILAAYCTCTREPLLWNAFVSWPRFPATNHRQPAAFYCATLRNITGTASLADQAPVTNPAPASPTPRATPPAAPARGLRQAPPEPAFNATTAQRVRSNILQNGCSGWVQDIILSLNPAPATYNTEAYAAAVLRAQPSVQAALRVWLGNKLKLHLQAQYRVSAAVFGAGAGTPLPESFADLLAASSAQLDNMLSSVYADVLKTFYYDRYVALCAPQHCDVTATKPKWALMIESIGVVGGLWALMLLGGAVLWRLASLLPVLRDRDAPYSDLK